MFNSDAESYGGTGVENPRVKMSKNRVRRAENSITVKLAPLSVQVFSYTKPRRALQTIRAQRQNCSESGSREENRKGKPAGKTEEASKAVKQ